MDDEGQDELHCGRFAIIPTQALDDSRITPALLKLLCVLSTYASTKDGYCYPKLRTLGHRLGHITPQAVSKNMQLLAAYGYVEIKPRLGWDGRRIRNDYRLLYDQPDTYGLENGPQVDGPQLPEVEGGQLPEVEALNDPLLTRDSRGSGISDRFTLSSAAASAHAHTRAYTREEHAAAAEVENDATSQTAEACRRRLHMSPDKLDGLKLIVACWPGRHAWLETQAALCWDTLKVRPLKLNHFSNWLDTAEKRRISPPEEMAHHDEPTTATDTLPQAPADKRGPDGLTDAEREAVKQQLDALIARTVGPNTPG